MIKQRSIFLAVVLTFITFGIYAIYLMAAVTNETNDRDKSGWQPSGGLCVLFAILTLGIYSVYWLVRMGIRAKDAHNDSTPMILIIVLGLFLGIGTFVILHYNNKLATGGSNQIA